MPKIFEYFGLVFYFWANDHLPIHVHASKGETESTFELCFTEGILTEIKLKRHKNIKKALSETDIKKAKSFIQTYYGEIVEKWFKFFVLEMPVESTKIKKLVEPQIDIEKVMEQVNQLKTKKYKK
jgi:hypothetical protein